MTEKCHKTRKSLKPTQKFHQMLMVIAININLPAIEVLQQLQHNLVAIILNLQLLGVLLAHQRGEHSPELFALRRENSLVRVNLLIVHLYRQIRKMLLIEQLVLKIPHI